MQYILTSEEIAIAEENGISRNPLEEYESKIVNTKEEVIRLSNLGFDCQPIGKCEWLMRKKNIGAIAKLNLGKTYFCVIKSHIFG